MDVVKGTKRGRKVSENKSTNIAFFLLMFALCVRRFVINSAPKMTHIEEF